MSSKSAQQSTSSPKGKARVEGDVASEEEDFSNVTVGRLRSSKKSKVSKVNLENLLEKIEKRDQSREEQDRKFRTEMDEKFQQGMSAMQEMMATMMKSMMEGLQVNPIQKVNNEARGELVDDEESGEERSNSSNASQQGGSVEETFLEEEEVANSIEVSARSQPKDIQEGKKKRKSLGGVVSGISARSKKIAADLEKERIQKVTVQPKFPELQDLTAKAIRTFVEKLEEYSDHCQRIKLPEVSIIDGLTLSTRERILAGMQAHDRCLKKYSQELCDGRLTTEMISFYFDSFESSTKENSFEIKEVKGEFLKVVEEVVSHVLAAEDSRAFPAVLMARWHTFLKQKDLDFPTLKEVFKRHSELRRAYNKGFLDIIEQIGMLKDLSNKIDQEVNRTGKDDQNVFDLVRLLQGHIFEIEEHGGLMYSQMWLDKMRDFVSRKARGKQFGKKGSANSRRQVGVSQANKEKGANQTRRAFKTEGVICLGCSEQGHHFMRKLQDGTWKRNCTSTGRLPPDEYSKLRQEDINAQEKKLGSKDTAGESGKRPAKHKHKPDPQERKGFKRSKQVQRVRRQEPDQSDIADIKQVSREFAGEVPIIIFPRQKQTLAIGLPNTDMENILAKRKHANIKRPVADTGAALNVFPMALWKTLTAEMPNIDLLPETDWQAKAIRVAGGQTYDIQLAFKAEVALNAVISTKGLLVMGTIFHVPEASYQSKEVLFGKDFFLTMDLGDLFREALVKHTPGVVFQEKITPNGMAGSNIVNVQRVQQIELEKELNISLDSIYPDPKEFESTSFDIEVLVDGHPDFDYRFNEAVVSLEDEEDWQDVCCPDIFRVRTAQDELELEEALEEMCTKARESGFPESQFAKLRDIVRRHQGAFRLKLFRDDKPLDVPPYVEPINTSAVDQKAFMAKYRQRRYADGMKAFMTEWTTNMVDNGALVPWEGSVASESSLCAMAPAVVVPKPNGRGYRLAFDLRDYNLLVRTWPVPHPTQEELELQLASATAFFSADALDGFWQIPLADSTSHLVRLLTHNAAFRSTRLLQGSKNASFVFTQCVRHVFGDMLDTCLVSYIDDILGFATTDIDEFLNNLECFLQRCAERRFYLNPRKFTLYATRVIFCGRQIEVGGKVSVTDSHRQGILETVAPENLSALISFLGLLQYLHAAVPRLSEIARPLQELRVALQNGGAIKKKSATSRVKLAKHWTAEHLEAFEACKLAVANAVTRSIPPMNHEVLLFCDASDLHHGAICFHCTAADFLLPLEERSSLRIVAVTGGSFNSTQRNWSVGEKEAYAVIAAVKRLSHVLTRSAGFHVYTDHKNLLSVFAKTTNEGTGKVLLSKLVRWSLFLSRFSFFLHPIAGTENVIADYLSRHRRASEASEVNFAGPFEVRSAEGVLDEGEEQMIPFSYTLGDHVYEYGRQHIPAVIDERNIVQGKRKRKTVTFAAEPETLVPKRARQSSGKASQSTPSFETSWSDSDEEFENSTVSEQNEQDVASFSYDDAKGNVFASRHGVYFPALKDIQVAQQEAIQGIQPGDGWTSIPDSFRRSDKVVLNADGTVQSINEHSAFLDSGIIRVQIRGGASRIWLPVSHIALHSRCLVVGHTGYCVHIGVQATMSVLQEHFYLLQMNLWVKRLVDKCLLCVSLNHGEERIPRPLFETMVAQKPGEIITFDFMSIFSQSRLTRRGKETSSGSFQHLLVIVDRMSTFCMLVPSKGTTQADAIEGLLQWTSIFPIPTTFYCDKGPAFTGSTAREFAHILGVKNVFSIPYVSHSNAVVERMNRTVKRCLRSVISSARMAFENWHLAVPMVQSAVNSLPKLILDGHSPMEVMMGLTPTRPVGVMLSDENLCDVSSMLQLDAVKTRLEELSRDFSDLHRVVNKKHLSVAAKARERENLRKNRKALRLQVGDFVLLQRPKASRKCKLALVWYGPHQVTELVSQSLVEIQDVVTGVRNQVHIERLAMYDERDNFQLTDSVKQQVAHDYFNFQIGKLKGFRKSADGFQIRVSWQGFEDFEEYDTWIKLANLYTSLPRDVKIFLKKLDREQSTRVAAKEMRDELRLSSV